MTRPHLRLRPALATTLMVAALALAGCAGDADPGNEATDDSAGTTPEDTAEDSAAADETGEDDAAESSELAEGITLAEVEQNASPESCWAIIDGTVYDLTEWIGRHPGGADRIEQLCGTDATEQFTQQHGGSSGPEGQLEQFEIGAFEG